MHKSKEIVPISKMEPNKLYFNRKTAKLYRKINDNLEVLEKTWNKVKLNANIINDLELRER